MSTTRAPTLKTLKLKNSCSTASTSIFTRGSDSVGNKKKQEVKEGTRDKVMAKTFLYEAPTTIQLSGKLCQSIIYNKRRIGY